MALLIFVHLIVLWKWWWPMRTVFGPFKKRKVGHDGKRPTSLDRGLGIGLADFHGDQKSWINESITVCFLSSLLLRRHDLGWIPDNGEILGWVFLRCHLNSLWPGTIYQKLWTKLKFQTLHQLNLVPWAKRSVWRCASLLAVKLFTRCQGDI